MIKHLTLVALLVLSGTAALRAESLIVTLSERTVDITSSFTGSAITIFGAVRRDAATVPRASVYDVVVTVVGPRADQVTRLRERVAGIWINRHAVEFEAVPSAYTVLSNRPAAEIAHPAILERFQIGVETLLAAVDQESDTDGDTQGGLSEADQDMHQADDPREQPVFETAFLRLQAEAGAYQEDASAVTIIDNALFRARAQFPADVPLGLFDVNVYLFSGGVLLAEERVGILVRKTGVEQYLFRSSRQEPLVYGLGAVLLALITGWLGGIVFRRT
ncbi:MAG: TIGR02186 family protein [Pseudomonadota bacterium]